MPPKLRYEFYLPTYYNDRTPIEPKKYRQVKNKIVERFGAISTHPATVQGTWIDKSSNITYFDNCCRFEICVDKDDENEKFFEELKDELKEIFMQREIYMIFTEVNMV
ncbi:hypothetical protein HYW76_03990 [Candidatus Pacearchaeota archaeon]|nr:hypothetical protein [Candidatus Pacearchaeota archaeon]